MDLNNFAYDVGSVIDFLKIRTRRYVCGSIEPSTKFVKHKIIYSCPSHTRKLIWVDPDSINYQIIPPLSKKYGVSSLSTNILPGDWDTEPVTGDIWYHVNQFSEAENLKTVKFNNYGLFRAIKNHFKNGVPWEDTLWYNYVLENSGNHLGRQYQSTDALRNQLHMIETIHDSISDQGYMSQRELGNRWPYPEYDEIMVNIGRNGEIYKGPSGRHRLCIAKISDIDLIPVRVHVRHSIWQKKRDTIDSCKNKNLPQNVNQHINHPDMKGLF